METRKKLKAKIKTLETLWGDAEETLGRYQNDYFRQRERIREMEAEHEKQIGELQLKLTEYDEKYSALFEKYIKLADKYVALQEERIKVND